MISRSGKQRLKSNAKIRVAYEQLMKMEINPDRKKEMAENLQIVHNELHEEERKRNKERLAKGEGEPVSPGSGSSENPGSSD